SICFWLVGWFVAVQITKKRWLRSSAKMMNRTLALTMVYMLLFQPGLLGQVLWAAEIKKDTNESAPPLTVPQKAGDLRWKLESGQVIFQEVTEESVQELTIGGTKIKEKRQCTYCYSWSVGREGNGRDWAIEIKIEAIKINVVGDAAADSD